MRRYRLALHERLHTVDVDEVSADRFQVVVDGRRLDVRLEHAEDVAEAIISPEIVPGALAASPRAAPALPSGASEAATTAPDGVRAPLPGKVTAVHAAVGRRVARGEKLVSIEAMKMVNDVRSPCDAMITDVHVLAGAVVSAGDRLVTLAPAS